MKLFLLSFNFFIPFEFFVKKYYYLILLQQKYIL